MDLTIDNFVVAPNYLKSRLKRPLLVVVVGLAGSTFMLQAELLATATAAREVVKSENIEGKRR